jgi:hypothetical protein
MKRGAAFAGLALLGVWACSDIRANPIGDGGGSDDDGGYGDGQPPDSATAEAGDASNDAALGDGEGLPADAASSCDGGCPPVLLGSGFKQPTMVLVDAQNIYFAESGTPPGSVNQCPKAGCGAAPVVLGPGQATGIVVDSTRVYWNDFLSGKIVACPIDGCGGVPTVLAGNEPYASGLTSDGTHLYWATNYTSVRTCALPACTNPTTFATGTVVEYDMVAAQGSVFWSDTGKSAILQCPSAGCAGAPSTYASGLAADISVAAGFIFWVSVSSNTVVDCLAAAPTCSSPKTIGSSTNPGWPVSDGLWVYYRDQSVDGIYKCPIGGCGVGGALVASNQRNDGIGRMAIDGAYLYWANRDGTLWRTLR